MPSPRQTCAERQERIEGWALVAALGAADPVILVLKQIDKTPRQTNSMSPVFRQKAKNQNSGDEEASNPPK